MSVPTLHFADRTTTDGPRIMRARCPRCGWRSHRRLPVAADTPLSKLISTFDALRLHFPPRGTCPRGCGEIEALIEEA